MLPALSPEAACALHEELVLWTSQALMAAQLGPVELAVAGATHAELFRRCQQLGVGSVYPQEGSDLGERMHKALQQGLQRAAKVVLVGSDCPQLDTAYLSQALAALETHDVVLGPATDGGYVLIAVTTLAASWFEGIEWGSESVYAQTVAKLQASATPWMALAPLQDVDRPEDLGVWQVAASRKG